MSHQDIATIWLTLQGRSDTDNIVQELTGRYCLQISQCATNRVLLRVKTFEHIVALRTVFDLQRAYLQASTLSLESRSSLLSPATLWSSLSHLLDLKKSVFGVEDTLPDHDAYCSFIGQTQLSGLRALLLHAHRVSQEDCEDLSIRYRQAWKSERLSGADHFAINLLGLRLLAELTNQTTETRYSKAACGTVKFPDFCDSLIQAKEYENTVMRSTRDAIQGTRNIADWFDGALILYDISWSTITAMIKLCMKSQTKKQSGQWSFSEEAVQLNELHVILIPRLEILNELYTTSSSHHYQEKMDKPQEQLKTMLCLAIQPTCYLNECTCLVDGRPEVYKFWLQHRGRETISVISSHISRLRYLEIQPVLKELCLNLEIRNNSFPDLVKELNLVSQRMVEYTQEWCPESENYAESGSQVGLIPGDMFVINCPDLHAISSQSIFLNGRNQRLENRDRGKLGDDQLLKDLLPNTRCTQCSWSSETMTARKVEPLSKLSGYIQGRLQLQRKLVKARVGQISQEEAHNVLIQHHEIPPLNPRNKPLPSSNGIITHEQRGLYRTPKLQNLRPIHESGQTTIASSSHTPPQARLTHRAVDESGLLIPSPSLRNSSSTITSSTSSPALHSSQMSHSTTRTFSPPRLPLQSQPEYSTLPEVVRVDTLMQSKRTTAISIRSNESPRSSERKSVWGMFKSGRGASTSSSSPTAKFFSSGKALLLWNELGVAVYELENMAAIPCRVVATADVYLAAGGAEKCAVILKAGSVLILRIFKTADPAPMLEMELGQIPFCMTVSSDDQYLALKYSNLVHIVNLRTGAVVEHILPPQRGRSGPNDHLVAFSTDPNWFIASTRSEPEQVITYYCACGSPSTGISTESNAPYGLVGDDGLSSIVQSGSAAFLTTFTEKGYPVYLQLSPTRPSSRVLRDKNQQIGSRIHGAVTCPTGQNLVLMNDRNEVFWIMTPFGKEQVPTRIGNIKRVRSVKREVELGMSSSDQVHFFWIEKGKGILVTLGRNGGKSKPAELNISMEQLLEGGV